MAKKVSYTEMDYHELEKLVKQHYPFVKDYHFVRIEECGNDSHHKFIVDGKLDKFDKDDWKLIQLSGNVMMYRNDLILNKLCEDGHIKKGEYLIDVCW